MAEMRDAREVRTSDHPIEDLFLRRWSPRAMSGEGITDVELKTLFEAARWAPSSFNEQPWRFLYAHRETADWPRFFELLIEANQRWCLRAAVLMAVVSRKVFSRNGKPNLVSSFDAGAAWENLALQATSMGLVSHGMAGFDRGKARVSLQVPDEYEIEAMIAVGRPGDVGLLPAELREREAPSGRMPIGEIAREGVFSF